jgi:hypothetical protein
MFDETLRAHDIAKGAGRRRSVVSGLRRTVHGERETLLGSGRPGENHHRRPKLDAPAPLLAFYNLPMPPHEREWTFAHSIDCGVSAEFAWNFWTDVEHWRLDADVESIEIDGPFAAGAQGLTRSKSSGRVDWRIAEVSPGRAVIEFPLSGAVGRFVWTFEAAGLRTRITQRCTLEGEQADTYAKAIAPSLEAGIPAGMQKLCEAMENTARAGDGN